MGIRDSLKHAWNLFRNKEPTDEMNWMGKSRYYGESSSRRQYTMPKSTNNEKSIVTAIYNRLAIDVASHMIKHVKVDEDDSYLKTIKKSSLNECLTVQANIDQSGRQLIHDIAASLFDEGVVAIIPVETTLNPDSGSFDITQIRTGKILQWFPKHVRCSVYNEETGKREEKTLPKGLTAIVENPFYSVMNEQNSTLKRLSRKLSLLDLIDENNASDKLNMIVQLPYVIKTEARKEQAEVRAASIADQLKSSKYGIAYADGSEKIIQLNRALENTLMAQVTYLTTMVYNQLGLTEAVFNGTADEQAMLNYYNRTIEPILSAITDAMKRTFLTKTARTQGQSIMFFKDPFKLVPIQSLADIADKFTRNEIFTSNEMRSKVGMRPSDDPNANKLKNKNIAAPTPPEGGIDPNNVEVIK